FFSVPIDCLLYELSHLLFIGCVIVLRLELIVHIHDVRQRPSCLREIEHFPFDFRKGNALALCFVCYTRSDEVERLPIIDEAIHGNARILLQKGGFWDSHDDNSHHQITCHRRGKVLQRVAADDVPNCKNLPVECLEQLCESVQRRHQKQIRSARITRRPQDEDHTQRNDRAELHDSIEAQVVVAVQFGPAPVENAEEAESHERHK